MLKMIFLFLFLSFAIPASTLALRATTVGNNFACFSQSDFDDLVSFAASGDKESINAYVNRKKCFVLKKGLAVTVLKGPGMFGGRAQCAFRGIKFWTFREALDNYR